MTNLQCLTFFGPGGWIFIVVDALFNANCIGQFENVATEVDVWGVRGERVILRWPNITQIYKIWHVSKSLLVTSQDGNSFRILILTQFYAPLIRFRDIVMEMRFGRANHHCFSYPICGITQIHRENVIVVYSTGKS